MSDVRSAPPEVSPLAGVAGQIDALGLWLQAEVELRYGDDEDWANRRRLVEAAILMLESAARCLRLEDKVPA